MARQYDYFVPAGDFNEELGPALTFSSLLLPPDTNPFAPLRELAEHNGIEGDSDSASQQARIISTAPNEEKHPRGSLLSMPERQHNSMSRDYHHARSARHKLPASVRHQDEVDSWMPVSYRRKQQNPATVAMTLS
ncbi:hypothetical protein MTO96_046287 [Rhipicephalus appendiculatus]